MNDAIGRFLNFLGSLSMSQKLSIGVTVILLIAGFATMFMWTNQIDYQVLFNNLSQQDAGAIVTKLKERNIRYKIGGTGTMVLVPAENVYELRLSLAGEGLPQDGNVGFEIFDKTDFGATRFVQEINYKRALQGELARTISRFREVSSSRVFIVLPKDSLFIEDSKPASASIQLDLRSSLPPGKLTAIVHLAASAVEGLEADQVTVVDTKGRVLFKGGTGDATSDILNNMQLDYKVKLETAIRKKVQSMLEGIVGAGKAIVRVIADVEFNQITLSEEEYDPSATAVRSRRDIEETSRIGSETGGTGVTKENQRSGILPSSTESKNGRQKRDVATNYEINKVIRETYKPAGSIKRLSVAAVIDGNYEEEVMSDGTAKKTYIPRTDEELNRIEDIVKRAMGYSEDREDQVSVASFPFSESVGSATEVMGEAGGLDILKLLADYGKTIMNIFLVGLIFIIIVRPLLKSLKNLSREAGLETPQLETAQEDYVQIPGTAVIQRPKEKALEITRENPERTQELIRGWIGE